MKEELHREAAVLTREVEKVYVALEEQNANLESLEKRTQKIEGKSLRLRAKLKAALEAIGKDNRNSAIIVLSLLALCLFIYVI